MGPSSRFASLLDRGKKQGDQDRVQAGTFDWVGADYKMQTILQAGGICVDQGYYAVSAGKARGVPTLLFRGAGLDGDKLRLCLAERGNDRPPKFPEKPEPGEVLILQRAPEP